MKNQEMARLPGLRGVIDFVLHMLLQLLALPLVFLFLYLVGWWWGFELPAVSPIVTSAVLWIAAVSASSWLFGTAAPGFIGWLGGMALVLLLAWLDKLPSGPWQSWSIVFIAQMPIVMSITWALFVSLVRQGVDSPKSFSRGYRTVVASILVVLLAKVEGGVFVSIMCCSWLLWSLATLTFEAHKSRAGTRPVDGWTIANSLCGYGSFVLSCLTLPLFLPLAFILPGGRERWIAMAMRRAMRFVFWVTPTITWRCEGEFAALDRARVVVMNHEGMLDILAACALPGTRTLLAKSWVFKAFPLGVAARAAGLRNSDRLLPEDYQEGVAATLPDPGVGIFVFPEGSRSRNGAIGRFRPGAFVLAKSLGCPVVPVAIAGSRLGIRPGSLWIHPALVVSRVLPPMALEPDETTRAFAARVRAAIVAVRHELLVGLLATPRMARNRRHFFTGLGPAERRAVAAEERTGAWRTALAATADDGDWLLIGCGWSTIPVTLRQLLPGARIIAWDPDARHRAVARHAWFDQERDGLVDEAASLKIPERLAGVVCSLPDTEVGRALLEASVCVAPRLVLVAGVRAPHTGFVPAPCVVPGWSASIPGG